MKGQLEHGLDVNTTTVGHAQVTGVVPAGAILNWVIRASSSGREYECNQCHFEVLI